MITNDLAVVLAFASFLFVLGAVAGRTVDQVAHSRARGK